MRGRTDGAHLLARRVLALLARDRLVNDLGIVDAALEITVDADPVHLAVVDDLLLADGGNVVLRLAGDHARVATRTVAQVDRHRPLVAGVGVLFVERLAALGVDEGFALFGGLVFRVAECRARFLAGDVRIAGHQQVGFANQVGDSLLDLFVAERLVDALAQIPVVLDVGEFEVVAGLGNRGATGDVKTGRAANLVGIEADDALAAIAADAAGRGATTAEHEADREARLAWHRVASNGEFLAADFDLDDAVVLEAKLFSRRRADECVVVPGDLGEKVRGFLQPRVVGEASIERIGRGREHDFEFAILDARATELSRRECGRGECDQRGICRRQRGASDETIVHGLAPVARAEQLAIASSVERGADQHVAGLAFTDDEAEQFAGRDAAVDRHDERLTDGDGAVPRTRVVPRLEVVSARQVPVGLERSFVLVLGEVHRVGHLGERCREVEISRRVVQRVAAEDEQVLHLASRHVLAERRDRVQVTRAIRIDVFDVIEGVVVGVERDVDLGDQRVDRGRLATPREQDRATLVGLQFFDENLQELGVLGLFEEFAVGGGTTGNGCVDRHQERQHQFRAQRQAMVSQRAGARERALDRPQAIHLVAAERRAFGATAAREVAAVAKAGRVLDEDVAIEGDNGLGLVELGERAQRTTERELGARALVVP